MYPAGPVSDNVYVAPANTFWKTPEPPRFEKFRPLFGTGAAAASVKLFGVADPPLTLLTSLSVGVLSVLVIVQVTCAPSGTVTTVLPALIVPPGQLH